MMTTRRDALMAGATGLLAGPAIATRKSSNAEHLATLVRLSAQANSALMRGDIDTYRAIVTYSQDFTFMSPFGGSPKRRDDFTEERMQAMGRFFRHGVFDQELIEAYSADDLVVLVLVERQSVEVGGLPMQEWPLRVTLVYRRAGPTWQLAHRHADPLFHEIGVEAAAALARGTPAATHQ
jgi:ketosteroid isomerase-like protein